MEQIKSNLGSYAINCRLYVLASSVWKATLGGERQVEKFAVGEEKSCAEWLHEYSDFVV